MNENGNLRSDCAYYELFFSLPPVVVAFACSFVKPRGTRIREENQMGKKSPLLEPHISKDLVRKMPVKSVAA